MNIINLNLVINHYIQKLVLIKDSMNVIGKKKKLFLLIINNKVILDRKQKCTYIFIVYV